MIVRSRGCETLRGRAVNRLAFPLFPTEILMSRSFSLFLSALFVTALAVGCSGSGEAEVVIDAEDVQTEQELQDYDAEMDAEEPTGDG